MKTYGYYPGCSLKATAVPYEQSLLAVAQVLGIDLKEIDDWNCCGATAYFSVREKMSHAISARNLALAEAQGMDTIVAPCSACFLGLRKTTKYLEEYPDLKKTVDGALAAAGLRYSGNVRVRHIVDVILNDVGLKEIEAHVQKPLTGLKVAGYVGCQMVRPFTQRGNADDPEYPVALDEIARACGATPVSYPLAARCCGGSQVMTNERVALSMCRDLLLCAERAEADCIITTCPLCHMNLDLFQSKVNAMFGTNFHIPVLFFTQLLGMAFGLTQVGIEKNIVPFTKAIAANP